MATKLTTFIREHRAELDGIIYDAMYRYDGRGGRGLGRAHPNKPRLSDKDRRDWIMNDEGLYNWARSEVR